MTPEREKEIRNLVGNNYAMIPKLRKKLQEELLAEIDELRGEKEALAGYHDEISDLRAKLALATDGFIEIQKERDLLYKQIAESSSATQFTIGALQTKLDVAVEALEKWQDDYGRGCVVLNSIAKEALSKIRQE